MAVTEAEVTGATTALELQKLQTRLQFETRQAMDEFHTKVLDLNERMAKAQEKSVDQTLTRADEAWLRLYEIHAKVRLGPAVITSTTGDPVLFDMAEDAFKMTERVAPVTRTALGIS